MRVINDLGQWETVVPKEVKKEIKQENSSPPIPPPEEKVGYGELLRRAIAAQKNA